jgi:hypothetical protein
MPADNINNLIYDEYQAVNAMVYNIQVMKAGTDSVLATANSTPFAAGTVYTIFLQGKADSLSISILPALY